MVKLIYIQKQQQFFIGIIVFDIKFIEYSIVFNINFLFSNFGIKYNINKYSINFVNTN